MSTVCMSSVVFHILIVKRVNSLFIASGTVPLNLTIFHCSHARIFLNHIHYQSKTHSFDHLFCIMPQYVHVAFAIILESIKSRQHSTEPVLPLCHTEVKTLSLIHSKWVTYSQKIRGLTHVTRNFSISYKSHTSGHAESGIDSWCEMPLSWQWLNPDKRLYCTTVGQLYVNNSLISWISYGTSTAGKPEWLPQRAHICNAWWKLLWCHG